MQDGKWRFDAKVADAFDDMLKRSIPQYEMMRKLVFSIGRRFVINNTDVVDLGCSRGEALAPFIERCGAYNRYVGVEVSKPMLAVCDARFKSLIKQGVVRVIDADLRETYPTVSASVTLSVLTLQFVPIEYRQRLVQRVYDSLIPGGAFLLVEKVLGADALIDEVLVDEYLSMKRDNGYTKEQIERKRLNLEGVLVPVTAKWNEELLTMAGFRRVDCFWRFMNFAGWVAVKS